MFTQRLEPLLIVALLELSGVIDASESIAGFRDRLHDTLAQAQALGVVVKPTSRFASYLELIAGVAAEPQKPLSQRDEALFIEALIQSRQLIVSRQLWARVDQALLLEKLTTVMKGAAAGPTGSEWYGARNTLAELTTAAICRVKGLNVSFATAKDVAIAFPATARVEPLTLECVRLSSREKIDAELHGARDRINKRIKTHDYRHGMIVLAVDHLLGDFDGVERLHNEVARRLQRAIGDFESTTTLTTILSPKIPIVGFLASGTTRVAEASPELSSYTAFIPYAVESHPALPLLKRLIVQRE